MILVGIISRSFVQDILVAVMIAARPFAPPGRAQEATTHQQVLLIRTAFTHFP